MWDAPWAEMQACEEIVPLARMLASLPWCAHWQSHAFAAHLRAASMFQSYGRKGLQPYIRLGHLRDLFCDVWEPPSQAKIYATLVAASPCFAWDLLFAERSRKIFGQSLPLEVCARIPKALQRFGPQDGLHAFRFLTNAWATSARMGDIPLPCLACLAEPCDKLSHYVCCPVFLHEAQQAWCEFRRAPPAGAIESPQKFWSLEAHNLDLRLVAAASHVFGVLKNVRSCASLQTGVRIRRLFREALANQVISHT